MPTLPRFDVKTNRIQNPHVVILGAGASIAACPNGDKDGRILPSLQNIQQVVDVADIFDRIEATEGNLGDGFEAKYSKLVTLGQYQKDVEQVNEAVNRYFRQLQLPDDLSIYDLLLLGLRDKDYIFTFNWDPFLLQAYRRSSAGFATPSLHFLHGCVDIALCAECKVKSNFGVPCPRCGREMTPSQLLYPVAEKDYESDPIIRDEWNALRRALDDAYFVTIFGYSAPVTDVAARKVLINTFSSNRFYEFAEVEIIDIRSREDIEAAWEDFFFSHHYGIFEEFRYSWIYRHFRRSGDAFAMATLQCHPVPENAPDGVKSVQELRQFASDLQREERSNAKFWADDPNPFGG